MSGDGGTVLHEGPLGVVRKNVVDTRYFVLQEKCLDFYSSQQDYSRRGERGGHLILDDIEELQVLDMGFRICLEGNRSVELRCQSDEDLRTWLDAITPCFDADSDDDEEDAEDVLFDSPLGVDINGQRLQKHFWLFRDRLAYTENEDAEVAESSFALGSVKAVTANAAGFEVRMDNRSLMLYCARGVSQEWLKELQDALSSLPVKNATAQEVNAGKPPQPATGSQAQPSGSTPAKEVPTNARQSLCQGELGVCLQGREENRYFVLFRDAFEYWSCKADFENGDRPRGRVSNSSIVSLEPSSETDFTLFFESASGSGLELRCKTEQEQSLWLEHFSALLGSRANRTQKSAASSPNVATPQQAALPPSASVPNFNVGSGFQPDVRVPGVIFTGSLTIASPGKTKKRHFALFESRFDYFETASAMNVERYPRGRILLRDIQALDFQDNGFRLSFKDPELETMVFLGDRMELPMWEQAWRKVWGVPFGSVPSGIF